MVSAVIGLLLAVDEVETVRSSFKEFTGRSHVALLFKGEVAINISFKLFQNLKGIGKSLSRTLQGAFGAGSHLSHWVAPLY